MEYEQSITHGSARGARGRLEGDGVGPGVEGVGVCRGRHNKTPQTGWLKHRLFSHRSGSGKSKVGVSVGLVSSWAALLGW